MEGDQFSFVCEQVIVPSESASVFAGTVDSGELRTGYRVAIPTNGEMVYARVARMFRLRQVIDSASNGQEVGIHLEDFSRDHWQKLLVDKQDDFRIDDHGRPVFDARSWAERLGVSFPCRMTGPVLRLDLEAARKAWIAEAKTTRERKRREKSDFLAYRNHAGLFADFHSCRHLFTTNLERGRRLLRRWPGIRIFD